MNKRFMSLLLVLVMVFSLLPISAMASVYLINEDEQTTANAPKVVFYDGSTQMGDPQYISSKDATVSDPGVPTLTGRQFFQGWCLNQDLTGESMTIEELNDYIHVQENYDAIKAAGVLNVYAKVVNSYTVTYIAKDADVGADIVQKVDVVPDSEAAAYKVSMSYTPTGANQEFRGWKYNNELKQQGDSLPVTRDIELNADVATGYWIKFDDNDKLSDGTNIHASYQKPVLVEHNERINLSDYAVSASGYEFQGWYTAADETGTKVEHYAAGELTADVTLYAHWKQVDTANYKVIIWKQNITGDGYDYAETVTLSGTPGSTINTVTQQGTGDDAYASINNRDYKYTGFHLKEFDQNVTIKPQGSSVLNVYYDRNEYTLNFFSREYVVDNGNYDSSKTYYGLVNGQYVPLMYKEYNNYYGTYQGNGFFYHDEGTDSAHYINYTDVMQEVHYEYRSRYGNMWRTYNNWIGSHADYKQYLFLRYTGTRYVLTPSTEPIYSITALYGQDISENFPITGTNGVDYTGYVWEPQNSSIYTSGDVPTIEAMREENTVFHAKQYGTSNTIHMYYYTEATGNESADAVTVTRGGKTYVEHQHVQISADGGINSTEQEDFITIQGYKHDGSDPVYVDGKVSLDEDNNYTIKFYYAREEYPINYQDGVYVKQVTDNNQTSEQPTDQPNRGQLKEETGVLYQSNVASYGNYAPTFDGYTFAGWFADEACTTPYTFTTMPVGGITVYAKWVMNRYAVEIKDGDKTLRDFTADYLEAINPPTTVAGHENEVLVGWFTGENFAHSFNPGTKINDNTTDLDKTFTTGGVKGKLTINAKWRAKLASCINVKYVADNGTAPTDGLNYTDESLACAKPAPTGVTGAQFLYWVVLDADGNKTNIKVYPGQTFTVDAQYAKRDSENEPYKLTLKAVYNTSTSETTALTYDPNGGAFADGSTDPKTENNLPVNGTVTLPVANDMEDGFLFLGWNHDETAADNHVVEFQPGQKVGVDKLPVFPNVLYAVWKHIDTDTYVVDYNAKMKLAEEATIATKPAKIENNGTFTVGEEGTAFYQLKQLTSNTKLVNGSVDLSFKGVDFARITGKFYDNTTRATADKVAAPESVTKYVNVVPASSVYFDDDLVNTNVTVGDGSGYNANVTATPAEATLDKATYVYTFTGTGIDIYCTTYNMEKGGYVQAILDPDTADVQKTTMRNQSYTERYNVPTISFTGLDNGEHTVKLFVLTNSGYKLDGIRIYNGIADQTKYADNPADQYAVFANLRDALIQGTEAGSVTVDKEQQTSAGNGVLFVDDNTKLVTTRPAVDRNGDPILDENGKQKEVQVYTSKFAAYQAVSPKHEIYLGYEGMDQKDGTKVAANQGITFELTDLAKTGNLWIGLSAPDAGAKGGQVTVSANGETYQIPVKDAMDTYYPLDAKGGKSITITNSGTTMISVTNLKITGVKDLYEAVNAPKENNTSEDASAYALPVEKLNELIFEPVTLLTVKLAANNGIDPDAQTTSDDSGTTEEPDDPKPGWDDSAYNPMNILKTLFQSLLNGLGNLFKGLGGW